MEVFHRHFFKKEKKTPIQVLSLRNINVGPKAAISKETQHFPFLLLEKLLPISNLGELGSRETVEVMNRCPVLFHVLIIVVHASVVSLT